ncbi:hypothetical protein [Flaviaesturariibacter amylovorans]|uniref:Uncharacterized protein n=1 Tax=Flaviaesturariibacter amylovorans TaxID=1084520 RepID=A0ABP8H6T2_9BACT
MENSAKQILSNLYGLLMELNFHADGPDVMDELSDQEKQRVSLHLKKIKLLKTKYKAEANRQYFQRAFEQVQALKEKGIDELKKLLRPEDQMDLVPLFRKFEEITEKDKSSILEDTEILSMIELLKERIDGSDH